MDVHYPSTPPTPEEVAALDASVGPAPGADWEQQVGGVHRAAMRRPLLLTGLHALQDRVGYISEGGLGELCRRLEVPPSEAYGVASFYDLFALAPVPPRTVRVCDDLACALAGADEVRSRADAEAAERGDTRVVHSPCLGLCDRAPAALTITAGDPPRHEITGVDRPAVPQAGDPSLVLLRRAGVIDPSSLEQYAAHGGFAALRAALAMGPARVVEELTASGLVGRGGAAFPAGRKWAAVAAQPPGPRYVVANADESEPGTFKDRVLMEGDPFAVVEAMTIAGFAVGAERGYLYLRGEYPVARQRLEHAIAACRAAGWLGERIGDADIRFDIELVRGAGAYICGEETAIFNSIEGFRGEPRSKPPFPVEVGLFGRPTLVNNIETLANVPGIVLGGGAAFAATGTPASTGTKLFCLSGAVAHPGVYEVPFGATLRELLALAGGVPDGRSLQAVLLGGAAGSFVGPDDLDLPLTFEGARAAGVTLGSGVVLVIDDTADLGALLRRIAAFFRHESCGQCVPCRVGTVRQEETLVRLTTGRARPGDADLLRDIGSAMRDASICGLGQTAWNAIESAVDRLGVLG